MRPPSGTFSLFTAPASLARAEAKAQLLLRLRTRGLRDLTLLRALENTPRENFVGADYADLALRDVAIPLPCGQTIEPPSFLAQMLTLLAPENHHRILEIGAGSGYSAAVLSLIGREVVSLESFQRLAVAARARLEYLDVRNVTLIWADGFEISSTYGLFDRILIHGALEEPPANILDALAEDGVLVTARRAPGATASQLFCYRRSAGDGIEVESAGACRAQALLRGLYRQD